MKLRSATLLFAICVACSVAPGVAANPKPKTMEEHIQDLSSPFIRVRVNAAAMMCSGEAEARQAVPALIKMLDDRTPLVWVTVPASQVGDEKEELKTVKQAPDTSPATEAAKALGHIGDRRATEPLIELSETGVSYERKAAIEALARIEGDKSFDILIAGLRDDAGIVASGARNSMYRMTIQAGRERPLDLTAVRRVLSLLENRPAEVRASAAMVLGDLQEPLAIPALSKLATKDDDESVRREAYLALEKIRQPTALPLPWPSVIFGVIGVLVGVFFIFVGVREGIRTQDAGSFIVGFAIGGVILLLGYLGVERFCSTATLNKAVGRHDIRALADRAFSSNESYPADCREAMILVTMGDEQVIKVLGKEAMGKHTQKRKIAQWVLARVIAENQGPKLERMARSPDPDVRKTVAWALKEMDDSSTRGH